MAVPSLLRRRIQRVRSKLDPGYWEKAWLDPLVAARSSALGPAAAGPPRFLVRVDEFPNASSFYDSGDPVRDAERFHQVMSASGSPYLIALLPSPADDPFNPSALDHRELSDQEVGLIRRMQQDGVAFAQHGTTHRTRHRRPRHHSELVGLSRKDTAELLDRGREILGRLGIAPRIFVAPYNRFSAEQYSVLAQRYAVVCGGPESIPLVGFHGGPVWWEDAVYLPSYAPLYGSARDILPAAQELIERRPGTWIPLTLHLAWEVEDAFEGLKRLLEAIAPHAVPWERLLEEVDRSRGD